MNSTFHIGQLVRIKQRSVGQGEGRPYCITRVLPAATEGTPVYVIKNMVGAERVVKAQDITAASADSVP